MPTVEELYTGVVTGLHLEPQWDRQARWALVASLVTLPLIGG